MDKHCISCNNICVDRCRNLLYQKNKRRSVWYHLQRGTPADTLSIWRFNHTIFLQGEAFVGLRDLECSPHIKCHVSNCGAMSLFLFQTRRAHFNIFPCLASNRALARAFRITVRYHFTGGSAGLGHPAGRFVHSLLPLRGHSEPRLFRVRTPARSSYTGCRSCQPATGERLTLAVMACCALGTGGGRDGTGWQVQHAVGTDFAASGLRPLFPTPLPLLTPWFLSLRSATRMECAAL